VYSSVSFNISVGSLNLQRKILNMLFFDGFTNVEKCRFWAGGVIQMVECLPSKHKAPSSNASPGNVYIYVVFVRSTINFMYALWILGLAKLVILILFCRCVWISSVEDWTVRVNLFPSNPSHSCTSALQWCCWESLSRSWSLESVPYFPVECGVCGSIPFIRFKEVPSFKVWKKWWLSCILSAAIGGCVLSC
jgi:hypothetical protein